MSTTPTISIVTPSFNQAAYLEACLDSVLSQNYPKVEFIVMDGGSTDGSVDILRRYEKHLTYWVSAKDEGQSDAINKGLARASGDILAYLNSDDFYLPGTFNSVVELYRENSTAGLLHGRCRYVDEHGVAFDSQMGHFDTVAELLDLPNVWWNQRQVVQPEVFWTRKVMDTIGLFRKDLHFVMDYDFWLRTLLAGFQVARMDREFTAFRFQPNQKSNRSEEVAAEILALIEPVLWDRKTPIDGRTRRRLQAQYLYMARLLPLVDQSVRQQHTRTERWARLAWLGMRNPQLLTARAFWERTSIILGGKSSASPAEVNP